MSNGVALDLPSETDLRKLTFYIARKWRPLWSWYATKEEALAIASSAIFESELSWRPDGKCPKIPWAIRTARLRYLSNYGHEMRMRKANFTPREYVEVVHEAPNYSKQLDLRYLMEVLGKNMNPRYWTILNEVSRMPRKEVAKNHGIGLNRLCQIEYAARARAREILGRIMRKHGCNDITELY